MSDVERPTPPLDPSLSAEGVTSSGAPVSAPARNMADIARLFLNGARPLGRAAVQRVAPKRGETTPSQGASRLAPVLTRENEVRSTPKNSPDRAPAVMLGLAVSGAEAATWKLLVQAARGLAQEHSTTVGVVGMLGSLENQNFVIDVVGADTAEDLPVVGESAGGPVDLHIARALHRLRGAIGMWMVAAPRPESAVFPVIGNIAKDWLLVCPTDNEGLISAYQHLKQAWVRAEPGVGPAAAAFLLTDDYARAAQVHKRLWRAAQEFLKTDLRFAGAGPMSAQSTADAAVRVLSVPIGERGAVDELWAAVLDELCPMAASTEENDKPTAQHQAAGPNVEQALEQVAGHADDLMRQSHAASQMALDHLAQVLDPEERAALAMGNDEAGMPVATARGREARAYELEIESATPSVPVRTAPREAPEMLSPGRAVAVTESGAVKDESIVASNTPPDSLRAFDLTSKLDLSAQWQVVEQSLRELSPQSILLDACPPVSWAAHACITLDSNGRLHIWTFNEDGTSWFALREWAIEHRALLALTRRDLVIDKEAEIVLHIVLPLEVGEKGKDSKGPKSLMRTGAENIHLYRMRMVQWPSGRGIMVVPIA